MRILNKITVFIVLITMTFMWQSCQDDGISEINKKELKETKAKNVKVKLSYDDGTSTKEGITIKVRSINSQIEFTEKTNSEGGATFQLELGNYEFSAYETRINGTKQIIYNGLVTKIIEDSWKETGIISIKMIGTKKSQLIIKEVYAGSVQGDDGSVYSKGKYMILHNNSSEPVDLKNLCIGTSISRSNKIAISFEIKSGNEPYWFAEDWTPVAMGYFYFPNTKILEGGKDLVVGLDGGGVDHTLTHSKSINLINHEYYICYDIDVFDNAYYYPAPDASIATDHYLKASKFGMGNAISGTTPCPHYLIFYPKQDPKTYGEDTTDLDFWNNVKNFPRKKIKNEWVVDALESFNAGKPENIKRIHPTVDNGFVYQIGKKGYTLYRNVDKRATETIAGNKAKLVYNYKMGTDKIELKRGSTDPSGIDAEASLSNGAVIIYMDTNNSSNDYHLRQKSSLRN